jgi:hypothetical protein
MRVDKLCKYDNSAGMLLDLISCCTRIVYMHSLMPSKWSSCFRMSHEQSKQAKAKSNDHDCKDKASRSPVARDHEQLDAFQQHGIG